eukprot:GHVU01227838.1.p1 GENE.GHVU01227838.1~~GHVU01227838.1.p1  ORF type:complete len:100 (-),score=3.49 GHVU01227838.1:89-388(-)
MNPSRVAIDHLRTAAITAQSASCAHNLSMLLHHHHAYTHTHTHVDAHMRKYTRMGADTTTHTRLLPHYPASPRPHHPSSNPPVSISPPLLQRIRFVAGH